MKMTAECIAQCMTHYMLQCISTLPVLCIYPAYSPPDAERSKIDQWPAITQNANGIAVRDDLEVAS